LLQGDRERKMKSEFAITSESELEGVIGEPMEWVRCKIFTELDAVMREFIRRSPLVFVSTVDGEGQVDISPKGDPAGFVTVDEAGNLYIPERPGNQLAFGFRNILRNGEIGLIFLVPNQRETLRVKGRATLHRDPDLLQEMQVNGKPALMYTGVAVSECFIHCGKALIRSKLWQPEQWASAGESLAARQFAGILRDGSEEAYETTKNNLNDIYKKELY
jgi:uncharacterized protein